MAVATGNAAVLGEREERLSGLRLFYCPRGWAREAVETAMRSERTPKQMTTKGSSKTGGISRRTFLKSTAGTAALLGAAQTQFPFGVHVAEAQARR